MFQRFEPVQVRLTLANTIVTKKRAETLTGYEIRRLETAHPPTGFLYAAFDGERLVAESWHTVESLALGALVQAVYRLNREVVLEKFAWRCGRCGRAWGLQIHHRKYRSHGGTHRPENLEPVCWQCHQVIHRLEKSK